MKTLHLAALLFAACSAAALAQEPAPDAAAPPPEAPAPDSGPPAVQYGPIVEPAKTAPVAADAAAEPAPKRRAHRNLPGPQADLRNCLDLKSNEDIIRCSEGRH